MPFVATAAIAIDASELHLATVCRVAKTAVTAAVDSAVGGIPAHCKQKPMFGGTNIHIEDAHRFCVCRQRESEEKALVIGGWCWWFSL